MFVFLVYSIVFWWFSSKGWDTSWHFQMQHNQAKFSDIHFLHGTVATTSTTTTITSQPPLSPTTVTTTTITTTTTDASFIFTCSTFSFRGMSRTKASFSHLPLSVPTTHSGNIWALPCLALACCSSWTSNVRQEKQFPWASVWPIGIMWFLCFRFIVVRGIVLDTWLDQKKQQNNDSGKPFFWNFLMRCEQSLRLPRKPKSTDSKRNRGKSGI